MELTTSFFQINDTKFGWISSFKGKKQNYSISDKTLMGLDLYLFLKKEIYTKFHCHYQIFNSEWIFSLKQVHLILKQIFNAIQTNSNISNQPSIEFLLYLSHQRQISKSIQLVGVDFTKNNGKGLEFGQIVFGSQNSIKDAVKYLLNLEFNNFTEFKFNNKISYNDFLRKYDIHPKLIKQQLLLTNKDSISDFKLNLKKPIGKIQDPTWHRVLLEAFNQKMVKLYLNNYKG